MKYFDLCWPLAKRKILTKNLFFGLKFHIEKYVRENRNFDENYQ